MAYWVKRVKTFSIYQEVVCLTEVRHYSKWSKCQFMIHSAWRQDRVNRYPAASRLLQPNSVLTTPAVRLSNRPGGCKVSGKLVEKLGRQWHNHSHLILLLRHKYLRSPIGNLFTTWNYVSHLSGGEEYDKPEMYTGDKRGGLREAACPFPAYTVLASAWKLHPKVGY